MVMLHYITYWLRRAGDRAPWRAIPETYVHCPYYKFITFQRNKIFYVCGHSLPCTLYVYVFGHALEFTSNYGRNRKQ